MVSEKEKQFVEEYKSLLKKYGVTLVVEKSSDEYGSYAEPSFVEFGKYCNINYSPEYVKRDGGYHGMGG